MSTQPESSNVAMSPASFIVRLIAAIVLINLSIVALIGLLLFQSQRYYQDRAITTAHGLTDVLEDEMVSAFDKIGASLYAVKDEYEKESAAGEVVSQEINRYIARVHSRLPNIDSLLIADERGRIVFGSDIAPDALVNIADRNYFIRQRDNPNMEMVISSPVSSRINGKKVIVLTCRLEHPDKTFAGLVLATVTLAHLTRSFAKLDIGKQGSISLRGEDLEIIARYPDSGREENSADDADILRVLRKMLPKEEYTGMYVAAPPAERTEHTLSYRKIADYPLYAFANLASEDYFARWRDEAALMSALAAGFFLFSLLSAGMIFRNWKCQRLAVEALAQQELKFRTLLELTPDALVISDTQGVITMVNRQTESMFGYERAELIGQPVEVLMAERYRNAHAGSRRDCEFVLPREFGADSDWSAVNKTGREFPVSISLGTIETGQGAVIVAAIRDIAERVRIEAELKALNETLETRVDKAVGKVRFLALRLLQVQDEERKHLARELHDETGQLLTAAALYAQFVLSQGEGEVASIHENAERILEYIAKTQGAVHGVIHSLRPSLLTELGLADSLRDLKSTWQKMNPKVTLELTLEGELEGLNDLLNISIYRFVQEGLTNVTKHAKASRVSIQLRREPSTDELTLTIADNGKGLNPALHTKGFGLRGMQERATAIGGELTVSSRPGDGVHIVASLPVNPHFEPSPFQAGLPTS